MNVSKILRVASKIIVTQNTPSAFSRSIVSCPGLTSNEEKGLVNLGRFFLWVSQGQFFSTRGVNMKKGEKKKRGRGRREKKEGNFEK